MKIERLNDNQIKVIMTAQDLQERDVTLSEVSYGSEKGQALFDDVMSRVKECYDFYYDENHPIIIEAIPMSSTELTFIISKITQFTDFNSSLNFVPNMKHERNDTGKVQANRVNVQTNDEHYVSIFTFSTLDDVIAASLRIGSSYDGENLLYKLDKKYFLIAHPSPAFNGLDTVLADYGKRYTSTSIAKVYILEHGEKICNQAIQSFAQSFSI